MSKNFNQGPRQKAPSVLKNQLGKKKGDLFKKETQKFNIKKDLKK